MRAAVDLTDPSVVSPGIAGFLTVFVLAVATWLLIRSMVKHLRKVRYAAEREAAEAKARAATPVAAPGGPTTAGAKPAPRGAAGSGPRPSRSPKRR